MIILLNIIKRNRLSFVDSHISVSYTHLDVYKRQALGWIQKANTMDAKYWKLRIESLILAKLGRRTEAVEVAQRSKALAAADGNEDYVKMNNESIAEWSRN